MKKCHNIISNICVDFSVCGNLLVSASILAACISAHTIETNAYFAKSKFWTALLSPTSIEKGIFSMDVYPIFIIGAVLILVGLFCSVIALKEACEIKLVSRAGRALCLSNLFSLCSVIVGGSVFALNTYAWSWYDCKLWSVLLIPSDPPAGIYTMDALPLLVFFSCCLLYGMILIVYGIKKEWKETEMS